TARVPRHDRESMGENVYNFAFAFVAPLGADDHRCLTALQLIRTLLARGWFSKFELDGEPETGKVSLLIDFSRHGTSEHDGASMELGDLWWSKGRFDLESTRIRSPFRRNPVLAKKQIVYKSALTFP